MPTRMASFSALRASSLASRSSLLRTRDASLIRWKSSWLMMRDAAGFSTGTLVEKGTEKGCHWHRASFSPLRALPAWQWELLGLCGGRSHPRAMQEALGLWLPPWPQFSRSGGGKRGTESAVKAAAVRGEQDVQQGRGRPGKHPNLHSARARPAPTKRRQEYFRPTRPGCHLGKVSPLPRPLFPVGRPAHP